MIICHYDGCQKRAIYGLFQLENDFTKHWVYLCDQHDKEVAKNNLALLKLFPDKVWEVK